jgi:hypothetical protein
MQVMVYYESLQPKLYQVVTSIRNITGSRTGNASSWSVATTLKRRNSDWPV